MPQPWTLRTRPPLLGKRPERVSHTAHRRRRVCREPKIKTSRACARARSQTILTPPTAWPLFKRSSLAAFERSVTHRSPPGVFVSATRSSVRRPVESKSAITKLRLRPGDRSQHPFTRALPLKSSTALSGINQTACGISRAEPLGRFRYPAGLGPADASRYD